MTTCPCFPRSSVPRRAALSGAVAGSLLLALTACGYGTDEPDRRDPSDSAAGPAEGGGSELEQVVLATRISELADLHPQSARSSRALALLNHVNEGLTQFNPDFTVAPALAEDWEISEDGLVYTFDIRDDVTWHDGEPFTPKDVSFTFETLMADDSPASAAGTLREIVQSVVVDDDDVVVTLHQPYSPLLSLLAGQAGILPAHLLETDPGNAEFGAQPVGTGPYRVTGRDLSTVTLEANTEYWDEAPRIARIVMVDSTDPAAQYASLLTGEIDIVEYDPNAMADLENQGARLWVGAAGSVHGINLDLQNPALADPVVRQALRMGLDRARIKDAGYPTGTAAEALVSTAFTELHADLPEVPFDPEGAGALLDEAGWVAGADGIRAKDGRRLALTVHTWPARQWQDMATVAQANWGELGAEVNVSTVENARIADVLSGTFDAAPLGWGLTADPVVGLELLLHSTDSTYAQGGTYNVFRYDNPEVDAMLEEALASTDADEQARIVQEIQQIAYDDVPFIPIAYPAYQYGAREGVVLDETGEGGLSGVGQGWFMDRWSGA